MILGAAFFVLVKYAYRKTMGCLTLTTDMDIMERVNKFDRMLKYEVKDVVTLSGPVKPSEPVEDVTSAGGYAKSISTPKEKRLWHHKDVNKGKESFAAGLNIYKIIWVFIVGAFIGVVFETLFVYFMTGEWMRRSGMLYGPFNQIYGMGAVLFTVLLYRFRDKNAFFIFLFSAIVGGIFEYLSSWVQQVIFGSVSWEYSDLPTNIGGRTNLFYAAGWGLMGLIFIKHLWPFLSEMIERIPNKMIFKGEKSGNLLIITGKSLTIVLAVFMVLNLALSGAAVYRAGRRAEGIAPSNIVAKWLDETYPDQIMAKKYPSMKFVNRFGTSNSNLQTHKRPQSSSTESK